MITKSCEDTGSTMELSNRSWDAPQICKGARALSGRRRRNQRSPGCVVERFLCPLSSASPWFTASCCRDGTLAVIQPLWTRKLPRFHQCLKGFRQFTPARTRRAMPASVWEGIATQLAHINHPHMAAFILILLVKLHASVRASGIEKERSCPTACATSSVWVDRDPKLPESAMGRSLWISNGFSGSTSSRPHSKRETWKKISEFRLPCSSKNIQECNRRFGTQRHDDVPNAPQWSQHRSGARFQNFAISAETRSVESVQQCHKIRRKQSSGDRLPLSPAHTPKQAGNTRATCRGIVDKATSSPAAHERMAGGTYD